MKILWLISLKFRLIAANFLSNLIGILAINEIIFRDFALPGPEVIADMQLLDLIFTPLAFIAVALFTVWYERPIQEILSKKISKKAIEMELS